MSSSCTRIFERARQTPEWTSHFCKADWTTFQPQPDWRTCVQQNWPPSPPSRNLCVIQGGQAREKHEPSSSSWLCSWTRRASRKETENHLCAPTGKAAALQESIQKNKTGLATSLQLEEQIPTAVPAQSWFLGYVPDSPYFRHNRKKQLLVNVVIVDEASMVDLALMAKLFEAIPAAAHV